MRQLIDLLPSPRNPARIPRALSVALLAAAWVGCRNPSKFVGPDASATNGKPDAGAPGDATDATVLDLRGADASGPPDPTSCEPGTRRCTSIVPETCGSNGQWQAGAPCPFVCAGGACVGECVSGSRQCDGNVPRTCNVEGVWQRGSACPQVCSFGACAGSCSPGSKQCSGNTSQTCGSDGAWKSDLDCPFVCAAGACGGACVPNDKRCSGLVPETCDAAGTWQGGAACSYLCAAGACGGECVPGARRCNDAVPQLCDGSGVWTSAAACPFTCDGGSCSGVCVPGDKRCNGSAPETCGAAGTWQIGAPCPYLCSAASCTGTCVPGSKRCNSNVPEACDATGAWQAGAACPYVCSGGSCSGSCTPDSKQCSGNTAQTCAANGTWHDAPAACAYVCSAGNCGGVCVPGSKRCSGLVPETCDAAGAWQSGTACPYLCSAGGCGGVCVPGSKRCSGLVPETCDATGAWQSGAACLYVCSAGVCGGVCVPGAKRCSGLVPETCDATGGWERGPTCPYVCGAGVCTGTCVPGSKRCSGLVPEMCDATGNWQPGSACPFVCSAGACAGSCAPDSKQCSGNTPQMCDATGTWQSSAACPYICSAGSCTGTCAPGAKRCSALTPQTCDATGSWQSGASCDDGVGCTVDGCDDATGCTHDVVGGLSAVVNLGADVVGRIVDVCTSQPLSLAAPWDRFRFDVDLVRPLTRDPGAFLADVTADGIADLVVAGFGGDATLYPGLAGSPVLFGAGRRIRHVAANAADDPFQFPWGALWVQGDSGDLDGDGTRELILGDTAYRNVGTASDPVLLPVFKFGAGGYDPHASVGDLNGDGKPDVVISANYIPPASGWLRGVIVFWNTSTSGVLSFTPQSLVDIVGSSGFVSVGDLNGDGRLDLAAPVGIYFNTGTTSVPQFDLSTPTPWNKQGGPSWLATSDEPSHVFLRDGNGDGLLDAYVSNTSSTVWQILYFQNNGTTTSPSFSYVGPIVARGAQVNNTYRGETTPSFTTGRAMAAAADYDSNGTVDIVVSGGPGAVLARFPGEAAGLTAAWRYPDLYTYPDSTTINASCGAAWPAAGDAFCNPPWVLGAWRDFTSDGLADALTFTPYASQLNLMTRSGVTPFSLASGVALQAGGVGATALGVALLDVDLDGSDDVVAGNDVGQLVYYRNTGSGGALALGAGVLLTDGTGAAIDVGSQSWPTVFDLDGDGVEDLLVGDSTGTISKIMCVTPGAANGYTNAGHLDAVEQQPVDLTHVFGGGFLGPTLTTTDVDQDGLLDVVVGLDTGAVWWLKNVGTVAAPAFSIRTFDYTRTTAAFLEVVGPRQARAHFALPVLRDQTTLAAHALPVAGGGTLSGRTPILWPAP